MRGMPYRPSIVLAGRPIAAGERTDQKAQAHLAAQIGRVADEGIGDSRLRGRLEETLRDVGLARQDAQIGGDDPVALGEVELSVGRRDDGRMRKRLEVVGHDGRRMQRGRALSRSRVGPRVDPGIERCRQETMKIEPPFFGVEPLLAVSGRRAAGQRGSLRSGRVERHRGRCRARPRRTACGSPVRGRPRAHRLPSASPGRRPWHPRRRTRA